MKNNPVPALVPRLRIVSRREIAFGPGKADLLARVAATGSISDAAKEMKMSYMRAWSLIQTMNRSFRQPLIATARGGNRRGGAELTATGNAVLRLYRRMETDAVRAAQKDWRTLQKLLRD